MNVPDDEPEPSILSLRRMKLAGVFFAATFILMVAVRLNIAEMYLMAATLFWMLPVAKGLGWYVVRGAIVTRRAPESCYEGDAIEIALTVSREGYLARGLISVAEGLPTWLERQRSRFAGPSEHVGDLGTTIEEVTALKRGVYQLGPVTITASDPLGLFAFQQRLAEYSEMIVYPRPQAPPVARLAAARQRGAELAHSSRSHGDSVDLHGTREYREGDELRHIHWPSTARLGRLVVLEREDPSNRRQILALDLRRGTEIDPGLNSSLEVMARTAAWLARQAVARGDAVGLVAMGGVDLLLAPAHGEQHYVTLLDRLAHAEAAGERPLSRCLADAYRSVAGSALAFFTTSPDEGLLDVAATWVRDGGEATGYLFAGEWTPPDAARVVESFGARLQAAGVSVVFVGRPGERNA